MKQTFITTIQVICFFYILVCTLAFIYQEKLIFQPTELEDNYVFKFPMEFEEQTFDTPSGSSIHSLYFKSEKPKGLVFYLHGNAGSLDTWGHIARLYTSSSYDVLMIDYPGFGKSKGEIDGEQRLYQDVNYVFEEIQKRYEKDEIIIIGYSIGTALASYLSGVHNPKLLILQSPFDQFHTLMKEQYPLIPGFLLNYKFDNLMHLKKSTTKTIIFHGKKDELINYKHSLRMKENLNIVDTVYLFENQGHNNMNRNKKYVKEVRKLLRDH